MMNNTYEQDEFPIYTINREDIEELGDINTDELTDTRMRYVAARTWKYMQEEAEPFDVALHRAAKLCLGTKKVEEQESDDE